MKSLLSEAKVPGRGQLRKTRNFSTFTCTQRHTPQTAVQQPSKHISRRKRTHGRKALWCFHSPLFHLSITGSMTVFNPRVLVVEGEELFVMKEQSFTALTCLMAPSRTNAKGLSICHITQHSLRAEKLLHREHFLRKIQQ